MEASTRLRRIISNQQEVERIMREKETQRIAQEHARHAARAEDVRRACAELVRNQQDFHKRDELLAGYRGADSRSHAVVKRSEYGMWEGRRGEGEKGRGEREREGERRVKHF